MTAQYLLLALVLAVTLNHPNRFFRAAGTLLVAIGLAFIVLSIYLADTDGTFAAAPSGNFRPALLNAQGLLALLAIGFLLWAVWRQWRRPLTGVVPWLNTRATFGLVSRGAHWATATLVLCLIPLGLFIQVLPAAAPERAVFRSVHETLGITVLVLLLFRIGWLARNAPPPALPSLRPWEARLAYGVRVALYASILLLPVTGMVLVRSPAAPWRVLHDEVLPLFFYGIIALHLGAVLKHHFIDGHRQDVRRMLR
jgi:cytochrome b561